MSLLTVITIIVGGVVMAAAGFTAAGVALYYAAKFTGKYAWRTWDNLASVYKLQAMQYWFGQMQENGTHALRKAHDEGLAERDKTDANP